MRRPLWNRDSFPALSRPKTVSSSSGVCLRTGALREAYFDSLLQSAADASEIRVTSAYETLRPAAFWTALKQASG